MDNLHRLSTLLREMNRVGDEITEIIRRPALTGHLGEFVSSRIFDIDLAAAANNRAIDGRFREGPLSGKSVNIKCYLKLETLDINPNALPDFFLVLTGPRATGTSVRGAARPFVISHVFLFDAAALCETLKTRGVKLQTGTSL